MPSAGAVDIRPIDIDAEIARVFEVVRVRTGSAPHVEHATYHSKVVVGEDRRELAH